MTSIFRTLTYALSLRNLSAPKQSYGGVKGMDLPLAPVERMLRRTTMRVSDDAVREYAMLLEEIAADIAAEAAANAKRAKRKTVSVADIEAAKRKLL